MLNLGNYRYILLNIHIFNRSKLFIINQYNLINCLLWTWILSSGVGFLHSLWYTWSQNCRCQKHTTVNIRRSVIFTNPETMLAGSAPRA